MKDHLNYKEIKEKFPSAIEMLEILGEIKSQNIKLEIWNDGSIDFTDDEGFRSNKYKWNDRMLFDFFDEFQISVEIQPSFDSKIRFAHVVSYMNDSCDKIIFKSEGVWIHRETAEKEAFEVAFRCLNILLEKGKFKEMKLTKLIE